MLLTLSCATPDALKLGYLLGKHPDSLFEREFSAGRVSVFYPEARAERITVALVTEVDPVGLVRGPAALAGLDQYVNDRPYVASSLTSVALRVAFSSAMSGQCKARPELVSQRFPWEVRLAAVACDAGEELVTRVFAPLGYAVTTTRLPLDASFPAWGQADLYSLTLAGEQTAQDLLAHLYVLLPVLDNSKHYLVGADETEKLLAHGGAWLAAHPARELIARRYLRYKRQLVTSALTQLTAADEIAPAEAEQSAESGGVGTEAAAGERLVASETAQTETAQTETADGSAPQPAERQEGEGLHEQRLNAVLAVARATGARSLADLGCGEGKLLALAVRERALDRILGMDVSSFALARARRRLRLDALPATQRARIEVIQGSLVYRDRRLEGFDLAALVEVIEHLDPPRLGAMERVLFEHARPRHVVVTTPNRDYNAHWESLPAGTMRHRDHRFEWTREECRAWAARVAATFGYSWTWHELGPVDGALGAPSQLVLFEREAPQPPPASREEAGDAGEQGDVNDD